jgi:hypothetical protein
MHYYQLGKDGAPHRERDWNPDLPDRTWLKLPLSERGQRGIVKNWGTRASRHFGLRHDTHIQVNR